MMKYILAGLLLTIFIFALMPGQMTPSFIVNHDKAAHVAAFFVLSLMLQKSFVMVPLLARLMVLFLIGVGIELSQHFFSDRGFSFEDIAYDTLGIALYTVGAIGVKLAMKIFDKQSNGSY